MTDRDALYRSICTNPDDDTPRLVYADWLEENGRAEEAEFIRVECRLHADAAVDADLLDRQEELRLWLKTHVPGPRVKFPAGLRVRSGTEWWDQTFRGFPRFFEFDRHSRTGVKPIRELAGALSNAFAAIPTRWLVVRYISIEQLAELLRQPVISELDLLSIQLGANENPLDDACRLIADSPHVRNLRGLSLAFSFSIAGAEALARSESLGQLRCLELEPAGLTPSVIRALAAGGWFQNLSELSLNNNCPADAFEELCRQKPFRALHTLELADNDFPPPVWEVFAHSKAFPVLAELNLTRTDLRDDRFAALAAATWLRPTGLDISACAIGNGGASELARSPWTESLARLDLRHNDLGPAGSTEIARCPRLVQLKHLDLGYNTIGPRTLQAIAANRALRGLTSLQLYCHPGESRSLTSSHFEQFLGHLDMPNLRHLDLSGRPIGHKAARRLTDAKFHSLRRLSLAGCKLSDTAIAALLAAPSLQHLIALNVSNNRLKTGVSLLTDWNTLPRLSEGQLHTNRINPDLIRKLRRRPGIAV